MADADWGPWIVHDGFGGPPVEAATRAQVQYRADEAEGLLIATESITASFPGFYWRWKRVRIGWFKTELRRVCDDPDYAPIWRYRLMKPRSTAVDLLTGIVAKPPGAWIKDATDSDNRLPKRVKA